MARVFGGEAPRGGFVRAATRGQPSDAIRRPQIGKGCAGRLRPRRDAAFPAQAQVAAWCAGKRPARAELGCFGPFWAVLGPILAVLRTVNSTFSHFIRNFCLTTSCLI
jgi:hypothetical protein